MISKTIKIDGKDVRLAAPASLTYKYRAQFGSDMFNDMKTLATKNAGDLLTAEELETMFNIAYIMAKCGDPEIPDNPEAWLDEFDVFPIREVFAEVEALWMRSLGMTVSTKKKQ